MHRITRQALVPVVLTALLVACGDSRNGPTALRAPNGLESTLAALSLHPYGIGADRSPGAACTASEYRQFDFWLGKWDVTVPGGSTVIGTNEVERELDGCVVEENWTDGGRGRSINFYDASTRSWRQHWVYSAGGPASVLILQGTSPGAGAMSMAGTRPTPAGATQRDSIAWTKINPDLVRQFWQASINGGTFFTLFDGRYARVAEVTHLPVTPIATCGARAANHQFDFLHGTWSVRPGRGEGDVNANAPRTSTVTTDLDFCLVEEVIDGPGNYRGWAFSGYQPTLQRWYRTSIDNRGQALVLSGGMAGGLMVMQGTRRTPSGDEVLVRVTWQPNGTDQVTQQWEFSRDGGATWAVELEVEMLRT